MNQADEKTLLDIARERLKNRPGAFERFKYELCYEPLGHLRALFTFGIDSGALYSILPPEYAETQKRKRMIALIDQWAAKQPTPRPVVVEALPPIHPETPEVKSAAPELRSLADLTTPRILKKSALVAELASDWPSIEADLQEAARNGLKATAHAGKHGEWDASKARAWALRKGKLQQARPTMETTASPWDRLGRR